MSKLQIYDRRERATVAAADRVLQLAAAAARPFRRRRPPREPGRILLLRLERIGDLLMALPAMASVRRFAPDARVDLVVGGWNADLARALPFVTRVHTLDAAWLARDGAGMGLGPLLASARKWRPEEYDLAINFEPDLRSNLLLAASGARWTAGYRSGGGAALLDVALDYDPLTHTSDNAQRLVSAVFGRETQPQPGRLINVPQHAKDSAARAVAGASRPLIGVHVNGGRAIKQWDPDRFSDVARRLITTRGATIVLTGSPADRPLVDDVRRTLPAGAVIDAAGDLDLLPLAALLDQLDLLITGDTGPMHLAAAVGTPIVAIFGPSDPARYAPRGPHDRIVRIDLPCSPCNRIRLPPERCVGHTPDCLAFLSADSVAAAAAAVLDSAARPIHGRASGAPA